MATPIHNIRGLTALDFERASQIPPYDLRTAAVSALIEASAAALVALPWNGMKLSLQTAALRFSAVPQVRDWFRRTVITSLANESDSRSLMTRSRHAFKTDPELLVAAIQKDIESGTTPEDAASLKRHRLIAARAAAKASGRNQAIATLARIASVRPELRPAALQILAVYGEPAHGIINDFIGKNLTDPAALMDVLHHFCVTLDQKKFAVRTILEESSRFCREPGVAGTTKEEIALCAASITEYAVSQASEILTSSPIAMSLHAFASSARPFSDVAHERLSVLAKTAMTRHGYKPSPPAQEAAKQMWARIRKAGHFDLDEAEVALNMAVENYSPQLKEPLQWFRGLRFETLVPYGIGDGLRRAEWVQRFLSLQARATTTLIRYGVPVESRR